MFTTIRYVRHLLITVCAISLLISFHRNHAFFAQSTPVTLSIALSQFNSAALSADVISRYEASHPGIRLNIVEVETGGSLYLLSDPDSYLNAHEKYVTQGDVVLINSGMLAPLATRAGYYLDILPLVNADSSFTSDDFYPVVWQSIQWDSGLWALPTTFNLVYLKYDTTAFTEAGLNAPESWTTLELADAVRRLARKDAGGKVIPGMLTFDSPYLFRSLLGAGVYDSTVIPEIPALNTPTVIGFLEQWVQLQDEGVIARTFNGDLDTIPIQIDDSQRLLSDNRSPTDNDTFQLALLPGNTVGVYIDGFAISAGTQYPQQAYELVKYLVSEQVSTFPSAIPAQKALWDSTRYNLTADEQAFIEQAVDAAFPASDLRYMPYLSGLLEGTPQEELSDVLQQTQQQVLAALALAEARRGKTLTVATPVPVVEGVTLEFNVLSMVDPFIDEPGTDVNELSKKERWNQVIQEFVKSDPQVKQIAIEHNMGHIIDLIDDSDCFYFSYNISATPGLLPLDALFAADPTFDKDDFIGGSLNHLQSGNHTYGYPLNLFPEYLRYDSAAFARANLPEPNPEWTPDAFSDALQQLKKEMDSPPFNPNGKTYYMIPLIASYGGLPIDYRTTPPTINFTEQTTKNAIRQVFDLVKQSYIQYEPLARSSNFNGDSKGVIFPSAGGEVRGSFKLVPYPKGSLGVPLTFDVGAGYISSQTPYPDACYRWLSTLAKHPELLAAMPARRTLLDSPAVQVNQSNAALYMTLDALLQTPDVLIFPAPIGSSFFNALLPRWLYRTADRYILDGADLDAELEDAEALTKAFVACVKAPAQITECMKKVDPDMP